MCMITPFEEREIPIPSGKLKQALAGGLAFISLCLGRAGLIRNLVRLRVSKVERSLVLCVILLDCAMGTLQTYLNSDSLLL